MKELKKLRLLKELYTYQSLGLEYFNDIKNIKQTDMQISNSLPNSINKLKNTVLNCHLCTLSKTRKNTVFGEGDINSSLFFIGEGPGVSEDETGRPFVGRAGDLLVKIIENVLELQREEVYISNIVKCRPPNNRVPTQEESNECLPYLLKEIDIINPKIIVTLGATAYRYLTGDKTPISKIRGEIIELNNIKIIPTFHPSYLLRNPSAKKFVFLDMKKVKNLL